MREICANKGGSVTVVVFVIDSDSSQSARIVISGEEGKTKGIRNFTQSLCICDLLTVVRHVGTAISVISAAP